MRGGPHGANFAFVFTPLMLVVGGAAGWQFAKSLYGHPVAADLWKQLLTVSALSALPLVALAMRAPAFATKNWRGIATAGVFVAFLLVLAVVGVCLREIARYVPQGTEPPTPEDSRLAVACIGTGVVLAAVACGVVVEFFSAAKTMEPEPEAPAALPVGVLAAWSRASWCVMAISRSSSRRP